MGDYEMNEDYLDKINETLASTRQDLATWLEKQVIPDNDKAKINDRLQFADDLKMEALMDIHADKKRQRRLKADKLKLNERRNQVQAREENVAQREDLLADK